MPLATLSVDPDELAERTGVEWTAGSDELGECRTAACELGEGGDRFVLVTYRETGEVTVLGSVEADLDSALVHLGLGDEEVADRFDRPIPSAAAGAVPRDHHLAEQLKAELASSIRDELEAGLEATRLAALATIEDVSLTPRQREVLQLMVIGLSADQIAERLGLSARTVLNHISAVRALLRP